MKAENIEVKSGEMHTNCIYPGGTTLNFTYNFETGEMKDYINEIDALFHLSYKRQQTDPGSIE